MSETLNSSRKSEQEVTDQIGRIAAKLHARAKKLSDKEELPTKVTYAGTAEAPIYFGTHKKAYEANTDDSKRIIVSEDPGSGANKVLVYTDDNSTKHEARFGYTTQYLDGNGKATESGYAHTETITGIGSGGKEFDTRQVTTRSPHEDYLGVIHRNAEVETTTRKPQFMQDQSVEAAISQSAETLGAIRSTIAQAEIEEAQKHETGRD